LTTHDFLNARGEVLCGHQPGQAFRTDPNAFGHPVYQVLADYQERWQTAKDVGFTVTWPRPSGTAGCGC
jgi:hypothetical protein